jgi:serine/threonine-protein kinase
MHASGECADRLNACYINECNRVRYGAIAYDAKSGAYGWSNDLYNGSAAEQQALANCREHGDGCKVVVDFWDSCAAVAADDAGNFGSAYADTRQDAEAKAITACRSDGGTSCAVQVWSCAKP